MKTTSGVQTQEYLAAYLRRVRPQICAVDLAWTVPQKNSPHFIDDWLKFQWWIGQEPVLGQNQVNVHLEKITIFVFHINWYEHVQDIYFISDLRSMAKVTLVSNFYFGPRQIELEMENSELIQFVKSCSIWQK